MPQKGSAVNDTDVPTKKKYDFAMSLGANCMAAHNLKIRNLRSVALPFDWTYVVDERAYVWLADHLCDDLRDLCRWENLREIKPGDPEWNNEHAERVKYIDTASGFRFVNHFRRTADARREYELVRKTLDRRIDRFLSMMASSSRVLMVVATRRMDISPETLARLHGKLAERFPSTSVDIVYVKFGASPDDAPRFADLGEWLTFRPVERPSNRYDFDQTNFEWAFLDEVACKTKDEERRRAKRNHFSLDIWPKVKLHVNFRLVRKGGES